MMLLTCTLELRQLFSCLSLWMSSRNSINLPSLFKELSGLGNRKKLSAAPIDDRYISTGVAAKTRSIISLGLSTFRRADDADADGCDDKAPVSFHVQTFDILAVCSEDYIVEPGSLKFLVQHGFDFNKQYSKGLTYYRGNDRVKIFHCQVY